MPLFQDSDQKQTDSENLKQLDTVLSFRYFCRVGNDGKHSRPESTISECPKRITT